MEYIFRPNYSQMSGPLVCHQVSRPPDDDGCLSCIREFPYLQFNIKTRHRHRQSRDQIHSSLFVSELLPNMLIKEELRRSSPLKLLLFGQTLKIFSIIQISFSENHGIGSLFVLDLRVGETLPFQALKTPKRPLSRSFLWGKLNYRQKMSQLCSHVWRRRQRPDLCVSQGPEHKI